MNGPRNSTTNDFGARFYTCRGEQLWSVTTMLKGGVPMPALPYWAALEVANEAVERADELPRLIAEDRERTIEELKKAPWVKRDRAAALGRSVHAVAEAYALGQPMPKWSPEVAPFMEQYLRFLRDFEPEYEMTEATVCNHQWKYAGTLDAIARLHPQSDRLRRAVEQAWGMPNPQPVIDTKTSASGVYPDAALQLAAYANTEHVQLPLGQFAPVPKTDGGAVLHLRPDSYALVPMRTDEAVFKAFLYSRQVFRWSNDLSKQVMGKPLAPEPVLEEQLAASLGAV